MKRKVLGFSLLANISMLSFGVIGLSACSSDGAAAAPYLKIGSTQLAMNVGETKELSYTVAKAYGSTPARWFSSNESVAYFRDNSKGYVTAVGPGEATITVAVGGSYADCKVVVTGSGGTGGGGGGGGDVSTPYLTVSPNTLSISVGGTRQLTINKYPGDAAVTAVSSDTAVATVTNAGFVTAVGQGSATLTFTGNNDKVAYVSVTVTESGGGGGGGETEEGYYGIDINKGYSASRSIVIGTPDRQTSFIQGLMADFNTITGSNIQFTFKPFEEGTGVGNGAAASTFPDVFPYASDQIIDMKNGSFLTKLRNVYKNWIDETSGEEARQAASLGNSCYGFPLAADNGVVMYYDASQVSASEIDTLPKLLDKANALGKDVNFKLGEGFYAAGLLTTFQGTTAGQEDEKFYTITATATGYDSEGHFNCANGIKSAKLVNAINADPCISLGAANPGGDSIATITNTSYVHSFKTSMANIGAQYAVAPLPYVDNTRTTRIGNYLGYKFMGVNGSLTSNAEIELCCDIAQFMTSKYAQEKRFNSLQVQPTMLDLQAMCTSEPHIAAIQTMRSSGDYIPLTSVGSELWSACATAVGKLTLPTFVPTDEAIAAVLTELDGSTTVSK